MSYPISKTATTKDGKKVRVGDRVKPLTYKGEELGTICTIVSMHRQGFDGTIARFDIAPNPEYPHHFSQALSSTLKA